VRWSIARDVVFDLRQAPVVVPRCGFEQFYSANHFPRRVPCAPESIVSIIISLTTYLQSTIEQTQFAVMSVSPAGKAGLAR
jgi:hypothetical protein